MYHEDRLRSARLNVRSARRLVNYSRNHCDPAVLRAARSNLRLRLGILRELRLAGERAAFYRERAAVFEARAATESDRDMANMYAEQADTYAELAMETIWK